MNKDFVRLSRSQMRTIFGGIDQFQPLLKPCGSICNNNFDCADNRQLCVSCDGPGKGCSS